MFYFLFNWINIIEQRPDLFHDLFSYKIERIDNGINYYLNLCLVIFKWELSWSSSSRYLYSSGIRVRQRRWSLARPWVFGSTLKAGKAGKEKTGVNPLLSTGVLGVMGEE